MPVSTSDIDGIPDYTPAHQLKMWNKASIDVASAGISHAINGRVVTRANAKEIADMIKFWEDRVAAADTESFGGLAIVQYGERQ